MSKRKRFEENELNRIPEKNFSVPTDPEDIEVDGDGNRYRKRDEEEVEALADLRKDYDFGGY